MKKLFLVLLSILVILGLSGVILPFTSEPASAAPAARGEPRVVIAEQFTATWCGYCPNAAGGLAQLQSEVGEDKFVVLAHHGSDNLATTETEARMSDYSVTGFPTVVIDGVHKEVGAGSVSGAYTAYKGYYDTRVAKASPLKMASGGTISSGKVSVEVEIDNVEGVSGSLNIRYILFEDGVSEGGSTYDHTVRDIIVESISSSNFPTSKQKEFSIGSGWNTDNLKVGIFVQVGANGEILQGKFEDLDGPLNEPPVVSNPGKVSHIINEDVSDTSLDLNTIFSDPESDPLTFTSDVDENSNIQVTIGTDGVVTLLSKLNWNGNQDVTFYATDSSYHTEVPHKINIVVNPVNDAPQAIPDNLDKIMMEDDTNTEIVLNQVFSDIDGDTLTYSYTGNNNIGVTIDHTTTIVTIDTTGEFHGDETVTFIATDTSSATGTKDVKVTVRSQNDEPVIYGPLADFSINEDEEDYSIDLNKVFMDPDGDPLYFAYDNVRNIGVSIDSSGKVTLTPRKDWFGDETIVFKATDKLSKNIPVEVTITVLPINDAPVPEEVFELYTAEDEEFNYQFEAKDIEGDALTFELNIRSVIKGLEKGNNYFFDETTGELTMTPTNDMVGVYKIQLVVKDDGNPPAESEPLVFTLEIMNTNDAPSNVKIIQPLPGAVYKTGEAIVFQGSAEDADMNVKDSGESLIYRWKSDRVIGLIGEGEQVSKQLEAGEHKITLEVMDIGGAVTTASITITVEDTEASNIPDSKKTTDTSDKSGFTSSSTLWWILAAIIVTIIVVFIVTLMFMRKKKPQLTPEEQQLQDYYDQLQNQGMLDPMAQQAQYGGYGYAPQYGGYPQQQMFYPQQQMVYPQTQVQTQPRPAAAVIVPQVKPMQPKPASVLPQAKTATPQLPPAPVETQTPTPAVIDKESLPKTKPVSQPSPQSEPQNGSQQHKDWQWNV